MKSDIRRLAERLLDTTLNHTQVGRLVNKDRDTVRSLRRRAQTSGLVLEQLSDLPDARLLELLMPPDTRRARCIQPDWDSIVRHILATGDSVQDTYEYCYLPQPVPTPELRHMSYGHFARELSKILKRRAPEYRHDYRPGEVMQIDFAGFQPTYIDAQRERRKCTVLLANFPFSQFCLGWVISSQARADSIHGLVRILDSLSGTPKRLVLDNFKAAIDIARTKRREAKVNPEFQAFLDHYGMSPDPSRGGEPRDKGSMEGHVKLAQRYFSIVLRGQNPRSLAELNDLLQLALDRLNRKVMRRWKISRVERFATREKPSLRPLPGTHYDYGKWHPNISVPRHYRVHVDGRDYSVPSSLIGKTISVKITASTIEIYYASTLVAVHARRPVTPTDDAPIIDPAHMPENHRAMWRQNPDALVEHATNYSSRLGQFVAKHLEIKGNPRATYNMLKRLLELAPVYGRATIDAACDEAIRRNQVNAETLRQLLARGAPKSPAHEPGPVKPPSDNIRGAGYYAEDDDAA